MTGCQILLNGSSTTTAITAGDMFIDALRSRNKVQTVEKLPSAFSVGLYMAVY